MTDDQRRHLEQLSKRMVEETEAFIEFGMEASNQNCKKPEVRKRANGLKIVFRNPKHSRNSEPSIIKRVWESIKNSTEN